MKNSLEIVIEQVRLEGGFKRGGRTGLAECLKETFFSFLWNGKGGGAGGRMGGGGGGAGVLST